MAERIGKDFIYAMVFLRGGLVGSLCAINVLELDAGRWLNSWGRTSYTLGLSYAVCLFDLELKAGCG